MFTVVRARSARTAKVVREQAKEPLVQVTAASAVGGAAVLGTGGAATGLFMGGAAGAAIGIVPALFTFGLSIPVGAVIGGSCGLCLGGAVGGTSGFVGGGTTAYGAYTKRSEIRSLFARVDAKLGAGLGLTLVYLKAAKARVTAKATTTTSAMKAYVAASVAMARRKTTSLFTAVRVKAINMAGMTKQKASRVAEVTRTRGMDMARDKTVQVTAASAATGAVVAGTGGAATGLCAGGVVGAAVGVVPAIFTFGLSIPFCAIVGGGCGFVTGTAVGSTAGAVAGGAGGYSYTQRKAIGSSVDSAVSKMNDAASKVKVMAYGSAEHVQARLTGTTGGSSN